MTTDFSIARTPSPALGSRVIKVILLGNQSVGKTSLRSQFVHHYFSNSYKATVGADFLSFTAKTKSGETVTLQIWDTAGQERFNAVSRAFYRGSDIAVLVYDLTNADSFHSLSSRWLGDFLQYSNNSQPSVMIVGNKSDCQTLRQISFRQAVEFASGLQEGLVADVRQDVIETSAKQYLDVEKLFTRCASLGLAKINQQQPLGLEYDSTVDVARKEASDSRSRYRCC